MPDQNHRDRRYLQTPVTITSASIITDNQNGVLQISAPTGATGTVTVTVTASDGTNTPVTQSFTVTIAADSTSNPANPFAAVVPAAPTSVSFVPSGGGSSHDDELEQLDQQQRPFSSWFPASPAATSSRFSATATSSGRRPPTGTTVTVTTDGTTTLTDGAHTFTAIQIAPNQTVSVTESGSSTALSKTADVPSFNSPSVQLTVDTVAPAIQFPGGA